MDARIEPRGDAEAPRVDCELCVVILNYRTARLSIAAAQSALADRGDIDMRVCIVDNCSGDGSAETIADWIAAQPAETPVTLLRSPVNGGVSHGNNLGMAAFRARRYLLLNSDAYLRPGALRPLLDVLDARPEVGLVGPRLEFPDGEAQISCFRPPSPISEFLRAARTGPLTRLLGRWDLLIGLDPGPEEIGWVSFAGVLLRGEMVERIGPMDEGFFLYSEDVEYCARARRAGWRIAFEPRARIVHLKGGSGPVQAAVRERKRPPRYLYASRARAIRLLHGRTGLLAANLLWTLGHGVAVLRRLFGGPPPPAARNEVADIWTNFLDPLGDSGRPGG